MNSVKYILNGKTIKLIHGDITKLDVDVIVNAANSTLLGGGGVDGAIHRTAGPRLLRECRSLNGCLVGNAKITDAYELPAQRIVHTVGPIWQGGEDGEAELLASCYRTSIELADKEEWFSVAFPCISTGVYGYPHIQAARIAVSCVLEVLTATECVREVVFCCYLESDFVLYMQVLQEFYLQKSSVQ